MGSLTHATIVSAGLAARRLSARLRKLRDSLGTRELAHILGIEPHSLRRNFSTGRWSKRLQQRAKELLAHRRRKAAAEPDIEREVIQQEPTQVVPGYGPEKQKRVYVELQKLRAQAAIDWQDTRNAIRRAERLREPILPITRRNLDRFLQLTNTLSGAIRRLAPPGMETLEDALERIQEKDLEQEDFDRLAPKLARRHGVELRAVYTLFFSPPTHGVATTP